eukprot:PhM_4_TR7586/c0_g1_i2/m.68692
MSNIIQRLRKSREASRNHSTNTLSRAAKYEISLLSSSSNNNNCTSFNDLNNRSSVGVLANTASTIVSPGGHLAADVTASEDFYFDDDGDDSHLFEPAALQDGTNAPLDPRLYASAETQRGVYRTWLSKIDEDIRSFASTEVWACATLAKFDRLTSLLRRAERNPEKAEGGGDAPPPKPNVLMTLVACAVADVLGAEWKEERPALHRALTYLHEAIFAGAVSKESAKPSSGGGTAIVAATSSFASEADRGFLSHPTYFEVYTDIERRLTNEMKQSTNVLRRQRDTLQRMMEIQHTELRYVRTSLVGNCFHSWRSLIRGHVVGTDHVCSVIERLCDRTNRELTYGTFQAWYSYARGVVFNRTHNEHTDVVRRWRVEHMSLLEQVSELKAEIVLMRREHEAEIQKLELANQVRVGELQAEIRQRDEDLLDLRALGRDKDATMARFRNEIAAWKQRVYRSQPLANILTHPNTVLVDLGIMDSEALRAARADAEAFAAEAVHSSPKNVQIKQQGLPSPGRGDVEALYNAGHHFSDSVLLSFVNFCLATIARQGGRVDVITVGMQRLSGPMDNSTSTSDNPDTPDTPLRRVGNFTRDFCDCRAWFALIRIAFPSLEFSDHHKDLTSRASQFCRLLVEVDLGNSISVPEILLGAELKTLVLVSTFFRLFCWTRAASVYPQAVPLDPPVDGVLARFLSCPPKEKEDFVIDNFEDLLSSSRRSINMWCWLAEKTQREIMRVLQNNRGRAGELLDARAMKLRDIFCTVRVDHMMDLLSADECIEAQEVLLSFVDEIREVYLHYACRDAGALLSLDALSAFVKDSAASKFIPKSSYDRVVSKVTGRGDGDGSNNNSNNNNSGGVYLTPTMFSEALIRLMAARFGVQERESPGMNSRSRRQSFVSVPAATTTSSAPRQSVPPLLRKFLEEEVMPLCGHSTLETVRVGLRAPNVLKLFKKHNRLLLKVFRVYARPDPQAENQRTITLDEYTRFIKEARLVDTRFAPNDATSVYFMSTCTEDKLLTGSGTFVGMTHSEFLEALALIAAFKVPDPTIGLHGRLVLFFGTHNVMAKLKDIAHE